MKIRSMILIVAIVLVVPLIFGPFEDRAYGQIVISPLPTPDPYPEKILFPQIFKEYAWSEPSSPPVPIELIVNGGFETGPPAAPWGCVSSYGEMIVSTAAHISDWSVLMGGGIRISDGIFQQVTIPSDAPAPLLSYWRLIHTQESELTVIAWDTMNCRIWDMDGSILESCGSFSNVDQSVDWIPQVYDMHAFRGQTVYIGFASKNDPSKPTQFFVDDVSLMTLH